MAEKKFTFRSENVVLKFQKKYTMRILSIGSSIVPIFLQNILRTDFISISTQNAMEEKRKTEGAEHHVVQVSDLNKDITPSFEKTKENEHELSKQQATS